MEPLLQAELPGLSLVKQGKVRDIFQVGESLLIVSTDRISAFDVVLPDAIQDKGRVLNQLSEFWFRMFSDLVENHLITTDVEWFPEAVSPFRDLLRGRSMLVRKAVVLPVECVVRGYLAGSAWREYQATGAVSGRKLAEGLEQAAMLQEPVFTPATKAETGHDENISFEQMTAIVGRSVSEEVERVSLLIYQKAREYAQRRGIIIADTKFEFGMIDGRIVLIDEVLTPDSSRFWDHQQYRVGSSPPSFDKQFVRDHLDRIGWDRNPPAPSLPPEIVEGTSARYREAFRVLTGRELNSQGGDCPRG